MTDNHGYIAIHRKILTWEWYNHIPTKVVFLHLLLTANHKDKNWQGIKIKRGQVLTGLHSLSKSTGLTVQQVRTALTKLKSTNEITIKSSSKNSMISITNYSLFQVTNKLSTNEQQTTNKPSTTTNNDNNDNNIMFDKFYDIYPKKVEKKNARVKFLLKTKTTEADEIIKGAKRYASYCRQQKTETQFIAGPAVWLNGERWNDELDGFRTTGNMTL